MILTKLIKSVTVVGMTYISEQLKFVPAQIKVIEHIRLKYSCRTCEQSATKTTLKIAPVPTNPIPKSIATPSLPSQIITSKYQ